MNNIYFMLAQAKGGLGDPIVMTIFMVAFIAFFYFVVVRPQNKKKKETENMLKSMKPGDRVITIGGSHGKIVNIKDDTITIRVDDKAEITFEKSAIARIVDPNAPAKVKASDAKKKEKDAKEVIENKESSENRNESNPEKNS